MTDNGVTVVIPTHPGREELLTRALKSVEAQTRQVHDVVIINDVDRNGAAWARNEGLKRVETKWVAWLDSDDEFLPNHVDILYRAAWSENVDLVYSYPEVRGHRDPLAVAHNGRWVCPLGVPFGPEQERHLRTAGNFIPVTHLVRTELVRQVGGFPKPYSEEFPGEEDWGLLIRLLDAGARFYHVPKITWIYHIWGGNVGGRGSDDEDRLTRRGKA